MVLVVYSSQQRGQEWMEDTCDRGIDFREKSYKYQVRNVIPDINSNNIISSLHVVPRCLDITVPFYDSMGGIVRPSTPLSHSPGLPHAPPD